MKRTGSFVFYDICLKGLKPISLWEGSKKEIRKFGHMFKLGLPHLPSSLVWTKISLDKYSYCLPYVPIQKVWKFLHWSLYLNIYLLTCVRILLVNNHVRYHQGLKLFVQTFFYGKSMAKKYPTYLQFGHMSKLS